MRVRKSLVCILAALTLQSCDLFENSPDIDAVVSYGDRHLSTADYKAIFDSRHRGQDSLELSEEIIDQWLLAEAVKANAEQNLSAEQKAQLDDLVQGYQTELYSQAYYKLLTQQNLDTVISNKAIATYYESRKENFKLNEDLIKIIYVVSDELNTDLDNYKSWLKKADSSAIDSLKSHRLSYKQYSLNPEAWLKKSEVFEQLRPLNIDTESKLIKPGKMVSHSDSTGVYLIRTIEVLKRGSQAPLSYVTPTVQQIILNRRKLEYITQLKKDLEIDLASSKEVKRYD